MDLSEIIAPDSLIDQLIPDVVAKDNKDILHTFDLVETGKQVVLKSKYIWQAGSYLAQWQNELLQIFQSVVHLQWTIMEKEDQYEKVESVLENYDELVLFGIGK